ncbi:branched-chain amino acid ABC transporter permease [Subtercola frigoramans]|uniref:Branched-chain amino acid transport system permease protein n=1 Tax=Subtercola frigoramans TaxID=120298 RepID=A0ABS2L990_9MICO|nr:branched-chain amino acid ABC transporter permease [Subtercola frigoramans]MBM7473652.1 branched-chain amino acid transport system permease protein [Subtercola frigoramans]
MVQTLANGLFLGSLFVLVALGLTLVYGVMGVPNFAQAGVMVLSAYTAWAIQTAGAPYVVAVIAAVLIAGGLSVLTEVGAYRWIREKPAAAPAIALGLSLILQNVALVIWGGEGKALNTPYSTWVVRLGDVSLSGVKVVVIIVMLVVTAALTVILSKTSFGRSIRAVAQDRGAAVILGLSVGRQITIAFFIAGVISGLAAVAFAPTYQVSPYMADTLLLSGFVVVIIGGLGSVPGAVIGGLGLGVIQSFGATLVSAAYETAFGFLLLVLVLVFRPSGIRSVNGQRVG